MYAGVPSGKGCLHAETLERRVPQPRARRSSRKPITDGIETHPNFWGVLITVEVLQGYATLTEIVRSDLERQRFRIAFTRPSRGSVRTGARRYAVDLSHSIDQNAQSRTARRAREGDP